MRILALIAGLCIAGVALAADPPKQNRVELKQVPTARLDLRAPKITELFSQAEIDRMLRATRDPDTIEEVEVEGSRGQPLPGTPDVPGGIFAPFWALAHPPQAWRIFAPLPPDRAARSEVKPDATDPYRAPMLPPR